MGWSLQCVTDIKQFKLPRLRIQVEDQKFHVLVDNGAGRSLIRTDIFRLIDGKDFRFSSEVQVELYDINNRILSTQGTVTLEIADMGDKLLQEFIVVDDTTEECVLGLDGLYTSIS